jgi:hypothetical protein
MVGNELERAALEMPAPGSRRTWLAAALIDTICEGFLIRSTKKDFGA